jgi:hypothetical protein
MATSLSAMLSGDGGAVWVSTTPRPTTTSDEVI